MLSKKGVSPLIATILLLAFAVALATVIIQLEPLGGCSGDEVTIVESKVCFNQESQTIKLFVDNKDVQVLGFSATVEGAKGVQSSVEISQEIKPGDPGMLLIPYDVNTYGNIDKITLHATLNKSNIQRTAC